jgi:hypothetical protein
MALSMPSNGMDHEEKELKEYSSLIPSKEKTPLYSELIKFNYDTSYLLLFNQDIWIKIVSKFHDIKDLLRLSSSNKFLYYTVLQNGMLKAQIELFQIHYKFQKFNDIYSNVISGKSKKFIRPEKEEKDIRSMAALKRKQKKILSVIHDQKNDVIDLYEAPYFEHLHETTHTTDEIIKDMVPLLLDHSADQNPSLWSLCPSSNMSDDLAYLAGEVQHNLFTRLLDLKRGIKIIGKNIPIVIGGTVLFVGAFSVGAYILHQQYPAGVFDDFMAKNTTYYDYSNSDNITENYFNVICPPSSEIWYNFNNFTCFTNCANSNYITGNWTDWIQYMHSESGCSLERLSEQLKAVTNATNRVDGPMICSPRDNSTLCCLRASQWGFGSRYSVEMLIGNAQEAKDAAMSIWHRDIGLYYAFASPLSLTFIWMLLLSHFCL